MQTSVYDFTISTNTGMLLLRLIFCNFNIKTSNSREPAEELAHAVLVFERRGSQIPKYHTSKVSHKSILLL